MNHYVRIYPFVNDNVTYARFISIPPNLYKISDQGVSWVNDLNGDLEVEFVNSSKLFPDILSTNTGLFLISNNFKKIIEEELIEDIPHIEFFYVKTNIDDVHYWALNILNNIKCFDWENSIYTVFESDSNVLIDKPDTVTSLVIDDIKVGDRNVFRMYEKRTNLFISQKFLSILVKYDISGYRITYTSDLRQIFD